VPAFVQMKLRLGLVADEMMGYPDEGLCAGNPRRITDQTSDALGLECHRQQMPIVACPAIEHVQPRQQPECVGVVSDRGRDLESASKCGLGSLAIAFREHEGMTERGLKLQLPLASTVAVVEN